MSDLLLDTLPITTNRLQIRQLNTCDLPALRLLCSDPKVMRFSLSGPMDSGQVSQQFERIQKGYRNDGYHLFGIFPKGDEDPEAFLGVAGLINQEVDGESFVELGYRFMPSHWGQGYATEAGRALRDWAFSHLPITRLICLIETENQASSAVAKRVGMRFWKQSSFHGIPVDVYALQPIRLVPVDLSWKTRFFEEHQLLTAAAKMVAFHQIGSTSIPGIMAKPTLDILGVVSDLTLIDRLQGAFERLGYDALGEYGMSHRRYFVRKDDGVHLHVFENTDPQVGRHLRFTDYLRRHPERAQEYSELKQTLVDKFPADIASYTTGKEAFIRKIDDLAARKAPLSVHQKVPRKERWNRSEERKALKVNYHLKNAYLSHSVPSVERVPLHNVTALRSNRAPEFNQILEAHFSKGSITRSIKQTEHYYPKGAAISWLILDHNGEQLGSLLEKAGWRATEQVIGMVSKPSAEAADMAIFDTDRVTTQTIEEYCHLRWNTEDASLIYENIYRQIPPVMIEEGASFGHYFLHRTSELSGVGSLLFHANVAGIYDVTCADEEAIAGMIASLMALGLEAGYHRFVTAVPSEDTAPYYALGFQPILSWIRYEKVWK